MEFDFYPSSYEPKPEFLPRVLSVIHKEERKKSIRRTVGFSLVSIFSFGGLIPMWLYLFRALSTSGFIQYFSLIFSDRSAVLMNWKEFIYTLGESLPSLEISIFLALVIILFGSVVYAFNDFKKLAI